MRTGNFAAKSAVSLIAPASGSLLAALVLTCSGCGAEPREAFTRVPIAGTVTLDQAPLDEAIIRFIPTGQTPGPKTMFPVDAGTFTATSENGPAVGRHRVEIELISEGEFAHDDEQALMRLRQTPRRNLSSPRLPAEYHTKSVLTAELSPPADGRPQLLEFSLSSRGR